MAFSASDAAFEGFRVMRRSPLAVVAWGLFYLLMTVAVLALAGAPMANFMEMASGLEGVDPSPEEAARLGMAYLGMISLILPVSLVFGAVLYAAVNRAVVRPEEKKFGYLRLGGDELRVLVVYFVLSVLMMLLALVLAIVIGLVVGILTGSNAKGAAVLAALLGGLVALGLFIWIGVRLSLAVPITVAERRIAIFDSWTLTEGRFWRLLGMGLLAFILATIVCTLLLGAIGVLIMILGGLSQLQGADLNGANMSEILAALGPAAIAWIVGSALTSALQLAIVYAPFARAYLDLKGAAAPAAEAAEAHA